MQLRLMDILADPDNPSIWPLKLKIFKSIEKERNVKPHPHDTTGLLCKFYCKKYETFLVTDPLGENEKTLSNDKLDEITNLEKCYSCISTEVIDGIIYHEKNEKLKWFIIDREIPVMYPLNLREKKMEEDFITRYKSECDKLGITEYYHQ